MKAHNIRYITQCSMRIALNNITGKLGVYHYRFVRDNLVEKVKIFSTSACSCFDCQSRIRIEEIWRAEE